MKRERLSLFVLLLEVAAITMLHSAKNSQTETDKQSLAKDKTAPTYQLKANLPIARFK